MSMCYTAKNYIPCRKSDKKDSQNVLFVPEKHEEVCDSSENSKASTVPAIQSLIT